MRKDAKGRSFMQNREFLIGQYINRLSRINNRWLESRLALLGLAPAHLPVFGAIKAHGALSQKELAALLHVEQPSMAQLLSRMERAGLIERKADPNDGRSSKIHLTKHALQLSAPSQRVLEAGRKIMQKQLTGSDLETLERLLETMLSNMQAAIDMDQLGSR
jgi:MarR family transcriptional regulator, transcriptional regulator for hemolysin